MATAPAEIEVVSDPKTQQNRIPAGDNTAVDLVVDVNSASAYGDLEKLRSFVERYGQSVASPDGNGYYSLQWAALNNYADIAEYIIEHGGDVNAADHTQQTALHWAAVRGSVAVAVVLLRNGARVEAADLNGYRPVHVAAQYGQTTFLNHIIAHYGADFDATDHDGKSPLYWAAYKGYVDTSNATSANGNSCKDKVCSGRISKIGYAPILLFVIIILLILFINSILIGLGTGNGGYIIYM
ncbi:putative protein S-acyltransferase 23 [Cocos nucifera]|uniref:protein S-acyltransferase n=1 Tax=Cocos nucifera TaxID=13894 RepID=A0A8K0NC26_COCNU|nr:putative protein S-acyltransferase 23 [Cocos nucifera]